ncbi:MAG: TetR/AcrR family transcriptional regulator [Rhodocyclaceae bacterium]|nr:TetR/AcrR family transcriptional regulator [Rhodocyclaceae bacterium]
MTTVAPISDTSSRILDAAERLFMAHGFEATTLRMITAEAQANIAAVNYHFGSKEALIEELFRRRLTWLNEQRLAALDRLEAAAGDAPVKPRQIVEAFFGVAIRMAADTEGGGCNFMRLLSRTYTEPAEFVKNFLAEEYAEVLARFKAAFFKALPDVPQEEFLWRFHFMLGAMSYAVSGADAINVIGAGQRDRDQAGDADALYARLMSFLIGGLRAPLPERAAKPSKKPRKAA